MNFFTSPIELPRYSQQISPPPVALASSMTVGQAEPTKYITESGVRKLNPAYIEWKKTNKGAASLSGQSTDSSSQALLTFSNEAEVRKVEEQTGSPFILAPSYESTMAMIEQDPDIEEAMQLSGDAIKERQEAIRNKYEIPLGLTNKLFLLSEYRMEFIVDDSYSMNGQSSRTETRWQEAQRNIKEMLEICSSIPTGPIEIRFLNQPDHVISIEREGKTPDAFLEEAYAKIDIAFAAGTKGATPVYKNFVKAFDRLQITQRPTSFYFFGDGVPNGGKKEEADIFSLLKHRSNPERSAFSLIICSNRAEDVKWMSELEEIAPNCSTIDDFEAEKSEVLGDQGPVFPDTKGMFQVCRLVASLCPDDLDAIDEGVPFTKWTLDNLLGVVGTREEYSAYFDSFCRAQATNSGDSAMDRVKKTYPWHVHYEAFLYSQDRSQISALQDYKFQLTQAAGNVLPTYEGSQFHPSMKG